MIELGVMVGRYKATIEVPWAHNLLMIRETARTIVDGRLIYKFFALLFANALSPKPQLVLWFLSSANSRLFGNDHFAKLFDKRIVGGQVIAGERRWKMFRRFMTLYDCREDPKKLQKEDP
eukprot:scaffold13295_cov36-Cyclotella_meneghiniana.AAC.4